MEIDNPISNNPPPYTGAEGAPITNMANAGLSTSPPSVDPENPMWPCKIPQNDNSGNDILLNHTD
jgi:hypothetical protein